MQASLGRSCPGSLSERPWKQQWPMEAAMAFSGLEGTTQMDSIMSTIKETKDVRARSWARHPIHDVGLCWNLIQADYLYIAVKGRTSIRDICFQIHSYEMYWFVLRESSVSW